MGAVEAEEVLTRDLTNGRVHKRFRIPGLADLQTAEGDNLDQAGAYEVVMDISETEPADLCRRCFPSAEAGLE
jgi:hypothetical protein